MNILTKIGLDWKRRKAHLAAVRLITACALIVSSITSTLADRLHLKSGTILEVEEISERPDGIWYRLNGVITLVSRDRVSRVERIDATSLMPTSSSGEASEELPSKSSAPVPSQAIWIYLVGGARMQVDEAVESSEGVWFRRANISNLLDKSRVERIERDSMATINGEPGAGRKQYQWSTGSARLDGLIRDNGSRFGVDPYLIFCVMEQESQFSARAVSPKGARGLMQLMPGTARRFGVRNVHDAGQNIAGGTRYLKELMGLFGGRIDLVLASYNAGEGAVMRYGHRVPPYAETRNYVRRISTRYDYRTSKTVQANFQ